ncbi:MAG: permease-like cell division protein FtsX [Actinomycetota bacterium]
MAIKVDQALQETFTNIRRNGFMTLASVLVVAVSLFLVGGVLLGKYVFDRALELQTHKVEVAVFLNTDISSADRQGILDDLNHMPEVQQVIYESKQEAYRRFRQIFADQPDIIANTTADSLPESFRVKLRDPKQFSIVHDRLQGRPGILKIQDYSAVLHQFFSIVNDIRSVGIVLVILLSAAAAMIIGTTIRIAIYSRRKEIAIMKLVGASNWFVRVPFMMEGVVHGLLGTILAVIAMVITKPLFMRVASHVKFLPLSLPEIQIIEYGGWLLLGGVALGAAGSLLGLRRFLDV